MSHSEVLLKVLNNDEEPLKKRMKIADNAFNSTELSIQHKEVLLLNWAINDLQNISNEDAWILTTKWLSSVQFKNLTQNDISNDDVSIIVELFSKQLQEASKSNVVQKKQIIDGVLHLCDNKVFQQYFKYNLELYCKFLSNVVDSFDSSTHLEEFLKSPCLFLKIYLVEEIFHKHFLNVLVPVLVSKVLEYKDDKNLFDEVSKIVQKCIFNGNLKKFETFFAYCLEGQKVNKEDIIIPKAVFKYLASTYTESTYVTTFSFKIIFHAFSQSFSEFHLAFKFLVLVVQMLCFDVTEDFNTNLPIKIKNIISLSKALKVLLAVLEVLSIKRYTESEVSKMSVTEFLRKTLMTLLSLKLRNSTFYKIILACIAINPLIIEPIASQILVHIMNGSNGKIKEYYEKVVIGIFEVFGKLHRIENFIAKIIPALKNSLLGKKTDEIKNGYNFTGEVDTNPSSVSPVSVNSMFTENILQCLTTCINGLASWQIINVFKTIIFHLSEAVNKYSEKNDLDSNELTFLEILGTLSSRLLQSVKSADHTVPANVIAKLVKGLEDLRDILKVFGPAILKREHNHITMRTFLSISYVWGEIYMTLFYYSMNNEVELTRVIDNTYTANNLRYLHSYLDVKQWQLISQRITNFGEYPCKKLLQKLYIQKLRAMLLFEEHFNHDIITNVVKTLQTNPEDTWKDLLSDKFAVNFIIPKMDKPSLIFLSENLIENETLYNLHHIRDSITLTNAVTYVVLSKINKLFKSKRKHDQEVKKNLSSRMFGLIPDEIFFASEEFDINGIVDQINELFDQKEPVESTIQSKEEVLLSYLKILKNFPVIYSSQNIQKSTLLFLFLLYEDILHCSQQVKMELEDLIIGILQTNKVQLTGSLHIETLGSKILKYFQRYDVILSLITDSAFKNENCIKQFEPLVNTLVKNLKDPRYLSASILVLQTVNKIKKSKLDSSAKEIANQYKEKILSKIAKLVCNSEYLIEAYATCLKHYLSTETDSETSKKLLDKLAAYIQYSLENINKENKKGCVILFTAVLHNKQKLKDVEEDIVLKIWNACKKVEIGEEYSHLVKLILTLIPNDEFHLLVKDLLSFTENSIHDKNYTQLSKQLKTWESILTCNVNPVKMAVWQEVLEKLIFKLFIILKNGEYNETLFKNILHFEESIIQAHHFILSPPLIDMFIINVSILMGHDNAQFETKFNLSISLLEKLLKSRNAMIMDRLPAYLQQYRMILNNLCAKSNSDQSADSLDVSKASDCAHKLEKLTKNLVSCKKDMSRISVFLIADILERYEHINLYPNVKLHLNNCVYSLVALCDHHAISYLMRVLSTASTEMFKILYEHYKRYYMFTGKV